MSEKANAHSSFVMSVAFSPDGTKIVSGSYDKTIKVWDSGAPKPSKSPLLEAIEQVESDLAAWIAGVRARAT